MRASGAHQPYDWPILGSPDRDLDSRHDVANAAKTKSVDNPTGQKSQELRKHLHETGVQETSKTHSQGARVFCKGPISLGLKAPVSLTSYKEAVRSVLPRIKHGK